MVDASANDEDENKSRVRCQPSDRGSNRETRYSQTCEPLEAEFVNKALHVCCKVDDDDERQAESYVDRLYEEFSDLVIHIEPDKWEIPDSMISDEQKNA